MYREERMHCEGYSERNEREQPMTAVDEVFVEYKDEAIEGLH